MSGISAGGSRTESVLQDQFSLGRGALVQIEAEKLREVLMVSPMKLQNNCSL